MSDHEPTSSAGLMAFGVCVPNFRTGTGSEAILAATQAAERLGWHAAWTTDHILIDDAKRGADYRNIYESLTVLAWLAGQTRSIRLGVSVLVVPMRNAVVLAKELATIDALSGGRLIAGVGIGWNRAEFENLGVGERFAVRGAYLEETVALWRYLWGGGQGPYRGRFDSFGASHFSPLPPQGPDLPVWIGATAEPALRRVGRIAQGYMATSTGPETMRGRALSIRAAATEAGRPMPTLSARLSVVFDDAVSGPSIVSGSPHDMAARLRDYRAAGVEEVALDFRETDADAVARAIERFHREVVSGL